MKWHSLAKDSKMERCMAKNKKDNFGHLSMKDKAQSTFLQINMEIPMTNQTIVHQETILSLMNVQGREMDRKKQYFGRFS